MEAHLVDILCLQEIKIDKTFPTSRFKVEGYKLYRRDRTKGVGGILIYINDSFSATKKQLSCKSLETLLIDMKIGNRCFAFIGTYKPPH